jgi:hypothetical protein
MNRSGPVEWIVLIAATEAEYDKVEMREIEDVVLKPGVKGESPFPLVKRGIRRSKIA